MKENLPTLLLADDDQALGEMLTEYLETEGFHVVRALDGEAALELARSQVFDAIVLDIMMPRKNGLDVLRALRMEQDTPVLMLTAKGDEIDHVIGLEIGADDYLGKPCSPRHLVARIRALLRRARRSNPAPIAEKLSVDDLVICRTTRQVTCEGVSIELTSSEYQLLLVLAEHAGQIVEKQQLSRLAFGRALEKYDRSMDMHLSNLRRKLPPLPGNVERIQTVRGIGYQYSKLVDAV